MERVEGVEEVDTIVADAGALVRLGAAAADGWRAGGVKHGG